MAKLNLSDQGELGGSGGLCSPPPVEGPTLRCPDNQADVSGFPQSSLRCEAARHDNLPARPGGLSVSTIGILFDF